MGEEQTLTEVGARMLLRKMGKQCRAVSPVLAFQADEEFILQYANSNEVVVDKGDFVLLEGGELSVLKKAPFEAGYRASRARDHNKSKTGGK